MLLIAFSEYAPRKDDSSHIESRVLQRSLSRTGKTIWYWGCVLLLISNLIGDLPFALITVGEMLHISRNHSFATGRPPLCDYTSAKPAL